MIGKVQGFFDEIVEVDLAPFAGHPARVLQHALDDVVGTLAVLDDFLKVSCQHLDCLVDVAAGVFVKASDDWCSGLLQFAEQFD